MARAQLQCPYRLTRADWMRHFILPRRDVSIDIAGSGP